MATIDLCCSDFGDSIKLLTVPDFELREAVYRPTEEIPPHSHASAHLCLVVEGGYVQDWGKIRVPCAPGSLVFHPPGEAYWDRISDAGSRCFTIAIEPAAFLTATEAVPALSRLRTPRLGPPSRLAFQLRAELELHDDLSATAVESAVFALLAELSERPALEGKRAPPPWLERVREMIHDEFARPPTLETLAQTAGVHRVHLAREFRRHYGCTVGEYIRQRRVELASHWLVASTERLSNIAFDAGFADQSHFTNTFRRLVGTTPGDFRARFHRRRPARREAFLRR